MSSISTNVEQKTPSLSFLSVENIVNNCNIDNETAKSYLNSIKAPVIECTMKVWEDLKKSQALSNVISKVEKEILAKKSSSNKESNDYFLKINVFKLFQNLANKFQIPNSEPIPCNASSYIRIQQENEALEKIWKELSKRLTFDKEHPKPKTANEIKEWLDDPRNQVKLNSVRILDLSNLKLDVTSSCISKLSNLQVLILSGNLLETIPECIGQLSELRILNLSNNKLTKLPSFDHLSKLESLILNFNKLTNFREDFLHSLHNLRFLYLDNNRFENIPNTLGELHNLETLSLDENLNPFEPDCLPSMNLTKLSSLYLYKEKAFTACDFLFKSNLNNEMDHLPF